MAPSRMGNRAEQEAFILANDANLQPEYDDESAQSYPKSRRRALSDALSDGLQSMTATVRRRLARTVDSHGSNPKSPKPHQHGSVRMHSQWQTFAFAILKRACLVIPVLILMLL